MGRRPCCEKEKVKKGAWSAEEDEALTTYLLSHPASPANWISLPQKTGLKRCGKSCRLRWLNYLRPNIKRGRFTEEEDNIILSLYAQIGSRWSVIAANMPGRTDNDVKNHWNTKLKKKLFAGGQTPKIMVKYEADTNIRNTQLCSNKNHNLIPADHNDDIPVDDAHYQQLHLPSFTSLLAQASYNSSPTGHTNTLLFDQFMLSSPPTYPQPHDQLVVSVKSEEAHFSTISGSSSSLFVDQTDEYLTAYPSHGSEDLSLEDTGLQFDRSTAYSF